MRAEILKMLLDHIGTYVSGESLMNACSISRQGVWKHIQALMEEGYPILTAKGSGYQLPHDPHILTQSRLEMILLSMPLIEKAYHFPSTPSTNAFLKEQSKRIESAIAVADEQTQGRGRLGKAWVSQDQGGLWFSILQRPSILPSQASMLTQVAAAAMVKTLLTLTTIEIKIKWPNDLMIGDRKLCGILTEMSAELHAIDYVVIGIGLNLYQQAFEPPLDKIATALCQHHSGTIDRIEIIKLFLENYQELYTCFVRDGNLKEIIDYLNQNAYLNGHEITIMHDTTKKAKASHVNVNGELVIQNEQGEQESLLYGEVSVRRVL